MKFYINFHDQDGSPFGPHALEADVMPEIGETVSLQMFRPAEKCGMKSFTVAARDFYFDSTENKLMPYLTLKPIRSKK